MSTAPLRAFIVFRDDTPSSPTSSVSSLSELDNVLRPSSPSQATCGGVSAPDKENVNPVTGRKSLSDAPPAKKRKEGALSTKSYAPPPVKKTKESKSGRSFGTTLSGKGKAPAPAAKRPSTTRRSTAPSRSRRTPPLPQVNEEPETETLDSNLPQSHTLSQSQIDARCYELTVLPLADLSKAFEQAPCLEGEHALEEKLRPEAVKEVVVDDAKSVDSGSDRAPSPALSASPSRSPSPERKEGKPSAFSTPERKRIYSAFTFSTPSPSAVRYAALRSSSETRFSDPAFEL